MTGQEHQTIVEAIHKILDSNRSRRWKEGPLAAEVAKITGLKKGLRTYTILSQLVSRHEIGGQLRNGIPTAMYYLPEEERGKLDGESCPGCETLKSQAKTRQDILDRQDAEMRKLRGQVAESRIVEIRLTDPQRKTRSVKGCFHGVFERVLQLAAARKNIFIYGPTGCGKSHLASQVAEALGLRFAFVSCTAGMSEGVLGGRLLPTGKGGQFEYVISEFIDCYENGGVFLFDEIDAADPNVLLLVNAALANGHVAVPNRPGKPYAKRHPDFICIAAANTVGSGADRLYSGRNKLDTATLDRFAIGKVVMGYDPRVEEQLCPDDVLRNRMLHFRRAIDAHRLERAMSTRFMRDAYDMMQTGWSLSQVEEAFFSGWKPDEVAKVQNFKNN